MKKKRRNTWRRFAALVMAAVFVLTLNIPAFAKTAAKTPSLNTTEKTIVIGKSFDFNVENKIKGSVYQWSSSNEKVAAVNMVNGIVTGTGKGKAEITCRVTAGAKEYLLIAKVTVLKPAVVVTITNKINLLEVKSDYKLKVSLVPASSNDIVTWSSSDKSIADIKSDGSFTAKKAGTVTLTATALSGRKDSVTIQIDSKEAVEANNDGGGKEEVKVLKEILREDFSASAGRFNGRGAATVAQTTTGVAAEGGKGYLAVRGRTANWNGATADITDIVIPGATYRVTGWVRYITGKDVENFKISQERTSRDENKYPAVTELTEVTKGTWTKISGIMEVSPSTTKCELYFETDTLIDFFVDNIVIEQLDTKLLDEEVVAVEPAKAGDIVYRKDFEDGAVLDSRASSTRTNTTAAARSGKASVEVKRSAGWDGAGVRFTSDNNITLASLYGRTVHASFYVLYKDGPEEISFKLNNRMEKADNSDSILTAPSVKKGEWTLIEADCFIADGATGNIIFIETENNDALTFYIDDVEIKVVK